MRKLAVEPLEPTENRLLGIPGVALRLGISVNMTKRLIADGTLKSVRIGDRRLITSATVDAYIKALELESE